MTKKVIIGKFGSAYGVHGWIKVLSYTEPNTQILNYHPWLAQNHDTWRNIEVIASKQHGKNLIVKLAGCDTPEQARSLVNTEIAVLRDQLPALEPGDYYWTDLEGLTVINKEDIILGLVDHLFATGSNDVLVVKGDRERLIPYSTGVVIQVDLAHGRIIVDWDSAF